MKLLLRMRMDEALERDPLDVFEDDEAAYGAAAHADDVDDDDAGGRADNGKKHLDAVARESSVLAEQLVKLRALWPISSSATVAARRHGAAAAGAAATAAGGGTEEASQ